MTVRLDRSQLLTDAGRCAVAEMWRDGWTQKEIAVLFGYKGPALVNVAIAKFLRDHAPEYVTGLDRYNYGIGVYGEDRRALASVAIVRSLEKRIAEAECSAARPGAVMGKSMGKRATESKKTHVPPQLRLVQGQR